MVLEKTSRVEIDQEFIDKMSAFFSLTYASDFNLLLYDSTYYPELTDNIQRELKLAFT